MKNKILRSMKQRVLTVLFISTVILFVVIFGMTTVQCVKAFSYDSLRIAETKTRESVEIFNENAEEYVLKTQFIAAQLQGKAYANGRGLCRSHETSRFRCGVERISVPLRFR